MVEFPDLTNLSNSSNINDLASLPNNIYPYFWLWIFAGLWIIISLSLFFSEKERKGTGNFLSSMAVASLSVLILSVIGTVVGIISLNVMIYTLVFSLVIIGIWIFSN